MSTMPMLPLACLANIEHFEAQAKTHLRRKQQPRWRHRCPSSLVLESALARRHGSSAGHGIAPVMTGRPGLGVELARFAPSRSRAEGHLFQVVQSTQTFSENSYDTNHLFLSAILPHSMHSIVVIL
ncbi:hypothetical protein DFH11DRAFT_1884369 [Phellopilus nigrolimitatus]|nr:hypothetical protein DFH11DRAFT_1884369 [Phellopilus nigrolimitatus]